MAAIKYTRPVLPTPPPIPIPPGYVHCPCPDKQEFEFVRNGMIINGVTGAPKMNADTLQKYI